MASIFHLNIFITCVLILQAVWTSGSPLDQNNTVCLQPISIGLCHAELPSFGFDSKEQKCVEFSYGGCGGNNNRFNNLEDCQSACEACSQPIQSGPCFSLYERYGFNLEEKKCVKFTYGGCMGNKNNFNTVEDCETKCM